uniref:Caveolin n=1 Tax=Trichogramma kaykai TaxID=54128 RepID=A0ABD2WQ68_9HYME
MVSDHDVQSTDTLDTSHESSIQSDYSQKNGLTSPNCEKEPKYLGKVSHTDEILNRDSVSVKIRDSVNNKNRDSLSNKNRDSMSTKNRDSMGNKNRDNAKSKIPDESFKVQVDAPNNEEAEKVEIYYFDHGNSAYYHTTDMPPVLNTDKYADKGSAAATKFWARIFGLLHIGTSFVIAFVLQLLRFVLFSLVRPLTIGVIQLLSDYFLKPLLTIIFNGFLQPFLILFYNIATSFRDCCEPLAAAVGFYIKELAVLFRACRLVEVNQYPSSCNT